MNYKAIMAAAVLTVFLISLSSASFVDNSDAYEMKEGESGIGYSVKDLAKEEQDKILPTSEYNGRSSFILSQFVEGSAYFSISDANITDYASSYYTSQKIKGNEFSWAQATSESIKITFKAKCTADGKQLFVDDTAFSNLLREVGLANQTQSDAEFTVTATYKYEQSTISTSTMEKNSAGDLVLTKERMKDYGLQTLEAEVKYTTSGGDPKEISFDFKKGNVVSMDYTCKYDFVGTAIADVLPTTKCVIDQDFDSFYSHTWLTVKYKGDERGTDTYDMNPESYPEYKRNATYVAEVTSEDMKVPEYHFYGDDPATCVFSAYSDIDDSLRSDEAMKAFLEKNGSIAENYSGALSGAEGIYDDMLNIDGLMKILGIVGIVFLLFVVAVIVLIVILVKVKKKR